MSDALTQAIVEAYEELCLRCVDVNVPTAVRSSATGEDAADASFAGIFDTYLGVSGPQRVLDAIRACWGSLFTARALAYRLRKGISHHDMPIAVGVIELIHARASGVAFSVHPVTGKPDRVVIETSWGWGEAIVQGLVDPDHIEVGKTDGRVLKYDVAHKKVVSAFDFADGRVTEIDMPAKLADRRVLDDEQIAAVTAAVTAIEEHYGYPVDVEWVIARHRRAGDPICIVQSRPVTVVATGGGADGVRPGRGGPEVRVQRQGSAWSLAWLVSGYRPRRAALLRTSEPPSIRRVESMRIVTQRTTGGPEVLEIGRAPVPEPLPTEVRVRVAAAGVNPVDWKTRAGGGMSKVIGPPPFTVGWDVAGTVDAVGVGVTRFAVGDTVFGMPWFPRAAGGYAEFVTAPSRHFAHRPAGLSEVEAAGLPLAGLTAWQCLVDIADVRPGQRVLIHAAAGGVGHLAVQIAKARGAYVIGTASRGKHDLLHDLGIDEAIDYRAEAFERAIEPVDVVYDLIGGDVAKRSLDVLHPDGRLICLPSASAAEAMAAAADRGLRATGMLVEPDGDGLEELAHLVDDRRLRVLVAETFPLERASHAHRAGELGHTTGKLVLTV